MEPGSVENLSIVYRSGDFLVVNKHWDVRIDSKAWCETLTLQKQLRHRFPELADPDTCYGFRFCHQLDFSTSGALCVALNKAAAGSAYRCFKERRVTKAYLALVRGHVQESQVTISYAIGRNSTEGRAHTMCIESTQGCKNPKPSLTELVVLEHGLYAGDPVSKVLLKPLTGRTHQLRVHCSALGHPVVGDLTYGQATGREDQPFRMMLHAFYLRIPTLAECVETPPTSFILLHLDPELGAALGLGAGVWVGGGGRGASHGCPSRSAGSSASAAEFSSLLAAAATATSPPGSCTATGCQSLP
ncbi:RNA pseudouridylate synthase domain-containing protein 1 isoform X2 [Cynocephalus volans]|uniref:RNA pseudouridylate synthase domain-containing protein 1 isoform X2 n=1 Tax=Cynocephalus volans TaxID=110931 RepID=UPI002FCB01D2